jgi:hypothetical protein
LPHLPYRPIAGTRAGLLEEFQRLLGLPGVSVDETDVCQRTRLARLVAYLSVQG